MCKLNEFCRNLIDYGSFHSPNWRIKYFVNGVNAEFSMFKRHAISADGSE